MRSIDETAGLPLMAAGRSGLSGAALVLVLATLGGCDRAPTTPDRSVDAELDGPRASVAAAMNSNAPFKVWHQGFNHGTEGWYGEETPGGLGWCGAIEQVDRGSGDVRPSAGTGYATVALGGCNELWAGEFGEGLVNAPWAPGPNFALFSEVWPTGGFIMELDIYLDPSWTAGGLEPGTFNFFEVPGTIFTYAASLQELATGAFHYFAVPVFPDDGTLSILGHEVTEAGWYTFRHVFSDDGGQLVVDFELAAQRGGTVFTEAITSEYFTGTPTSTFTPTSFGSGYVWFAGIAPGLEIPIDEHRVRRGG